METEQFNNYLANLSAREKKENILLGLLAILGFTDAGVNDLVLLDEDTVQIQFEGGYTKKVNICMDSEVAIIRDIMKQI